MTGKTDEELDPPPQEIKFAKIKHKYSFLMRRTPRINRGILPLQHLDHILTN